MRTLTIEQYRASKGLPSAGLGLDHSMISPNGRVSDRQKEAGLAKMRETWSALLVADDEYVAAIRSGEIVDPSGAYSAERFRRIDAERVAKDIAINEGHIRFYTSIGQGRRGLRPKFARIVAEYQAKIDALRPLVAV